MSNRLTDDQIESLGLLIAQHLNCSLSTALVKDTDGEYLQVVVSNTRIFRIFANGITYEFHGLSMNRVQLNGR